MADALSSIDFFGVDIRWNYKGSDKQKTIAGTLMTIVFVGLTFWSIISVARALFQREDPEVTQSILFDSDPPNTNLSPKEFGFAFGLIEAVTYDHFLDESYYTLQVIYRTQAREIDEDNPENQSLDITEYDLNLVPCANPERFGENSKMFEDLPLNLIYCIDPDEDLNIKLEGVFESPQYNVIDFYLFPCINSTQNGNHCQPQEVIDKRLEGASFIVYFSDSSIDPENLDEPQLTFRNSLFNMISPTVYKEIYYYIRNVEITTDTGVLGDSLSVKNFIQFDKAFETSAHLYRSNLQMMQFRMKLSQSRISYQRRYPKIAQILAEISGILETYIIAMVFIITPIQRFLFYQKFIHESFVVDQEILNTNKPKKKGQVMNLSESRHESESNQKGLENRKQEETQQENLFTGTKHHTRITKTLLSSPNSKEKSENNLTSNIMDKSLIHNVDTKIKEEIGTMILRSESYKSMVTAPQAKQKQVKNGEYFVRRQTPDADKIDLDVSLNMTQQPMLADNSADSKVLDTRNSTPIKNAIRLYPIKKEKKFSSPKPKHIDLNFSWKGQSRNNTPKNDESPTKNLNMTVAQSRHINMVTKEDKNNRINFFKNADFDDEVVITKPDDSEIKEMQMDEDECGGNDEIIGEKAFVEEEDEKIEKKENAKPSKDKVETPSEDIQPQLEKLQDQKALKSISGKSDCKITLCEYIMSFFGSTAFSKRYKKKRKVYDVGFQEVENILDVHNYYRILKEIELIKSLLLKEDEQKVFDEIVKQKQDITSLFLKDKPVNKKK